MFALQKVMVFGASEKELMVAVAFFSQKTAVLPSPAAYMRRREGWDSSICS